MSSRVLTSLAEVSRLVPFVAAVPVGAVVAALSLLLLRCFVAAALLCACRFADMSLIFITVNCFRY